MAKQRRLYNGEKTICWAPGYLAKFENGSAVLDTPGGLCPAGGGKPGGLGCGSLFVNKKTQQFIQITLTTGKYIKTKAPVQRGSSVGCHWKRKCCVGHSWWLRPTGGGKPSGLGCGSLWVTVRTLKSTRKPNRSLLVTYLDFSEKLKTEVLCWTLLVDFIQPVEEN